MEPRGLASSPPPAAYSDDYCRRLPPSCRRHVTADGNWRPGADPLMQRARRLGPVRGAGDEPVSRSVRHYAAATAVERNSGLPKGPPGCSPESDIVTNHCRGATRSQPSKGGRLDGSVSSAHCPIAATDWRCSAARTTAASPSPPSTSASFMDPADVRQFGRYKDKSELRSTSLHEGLNRNSQPHCYSLNSDVEHHHSSSPMAPKLPRQPSPQQQKQQQQQPSPSPPPPLPPQPQAPLSQRSTNVKHSRTQSIDMDGKTSAKDRLRTSSASESSRGSSTKASAPPPPAAAAATAADAGAAIDAGAVATSAPIRNGSPQPFSWPDSTRASPTCTHVGSQRQTSLIQSPSTPAHISHPLVPSLYLSLTRASQALPVPSAQVVPPVAAPVPHMATPPTSSPIMSSMQMESSRATKVSPSQLVPKFVTETASSTFFQPLAAQARLGASVPPPAPVPPSHLSSTSSSSSSLSSISLSASSPSTSPLTSPATSAALPPVPSHFPPATESMLPATCFGRKAQGHVAPASALGPSKKDAMLHATTSTFPLGAMTVSPSLLGERENGDDGASSGVTSESIEYYKQNSQCINWQDVHELCASMDIAGMRIEEVYIQCLPATKKLTDGEDFAAGKSAQEGSALVSTTAREVQPEEVLMALKFQNMTLMHYPGDHGTRQRFHEVYINQ